MVGVRPLLTACGDPAVGSFALLALLAPVSEYGQVAIDTRAAESPRWSCTEDIFDRKHTVKVQSHLSQHVSVQLWRNTTPSRCQPYTLKRMRCPTSVQLSVRRWRFLLRLTLVRAEEQVPGATSLGRSS
jgi:hypothetical protein